MHSRPMADRTFLEKCITLGPWGSPTGDEWVYVPEGFIKKIRISHDATSVNSMAGAINSIEFHSSSSEGATQKSLFGTQQSGNETKAICIDFLDEYLTSLIGTDDGVPLNSICFHTNQNRYGPYGSGNGYHYGRSFSYDGKGGVIVGFHGRRSNGYITAIGFYVMPKSLAMDRYSTIEATSRPQKCCRVSKLESPRDVGPWGPSEGKPWNDGVFCNIKQVRVRLGEPSQVILGVQFKYVRSDGKFILSRVHGGIDDGVISEMEIDLDGVQEYLTGISGFFGPIEGYDKKGITSITFHTNKGKHGPYGQKSGAGCVYFTSTTSSGKVVGFHGRSSDFLTAIGVHMEYF